MTSTTDFDRLLTSWLETAGPPDVIDDVVTAAFVETRTLPQRRGLRGRLAGADPWPRGRASAPRSLGVLALAVVGLLVLALAGLAAVGARLVDQLEDPPSPMSFSGPYAIPVTAGNAVQAGDGSVLVFGADSPAGYGGPTSYREQVLRLDLERNELTPIGTTPFTVLSAIALRSGDVLVVLPSDVVQPRQDPGCCDPPTVGILRPATGEFVVAGQTTSANLWSAAVQLAGDDPRVLFVGGDGADSTLAELCAEAKPPPPPKRRPRRHLRAPGRPRRSPSRPRLGPWTPPRPRGRRGPSCRCSRRTPR